MQTVREHVVIKEHSNGVRYDEERLHNMSETLLLLFKPLYTGHGAGCDPIECLANLCPFDQLGCCATTHNGEHYTVVQEELARRGAIV